MGMESNHRHKGFQPFALPTELPHQITCLSKLSTTYSVILRSFTHQSDSRILRSEQDLNLYGIFWTYISFRLECEYHLRLPIPPPDYFWGWVPLCCLKSDTHLLSDSLLGQITFPFSREQHNFLRLSSSVLVLITRVRLWLRSTAL